MNVLMLLFSLASVPIAGVTTSAADSDKNFKANAKSQEYAKPSSNERWVIFATYSDAFVFADRNSITKNYTRILIYYKNRVLVGEELANTTILDVNYVCDTNPANRKIAYSAPKTISEYENAFPAKEATMLQSIKHFKAGGFSENIYAQSCGAAFGLPVEGDERMNVSGEREVYNAPSWSKLKGDNPHIYDSKMTAIGFANFWFKNGFKSKSETIAIAKSRD